MTHENATEIMNILKIMQQSINESCNSRGTCATMVSILQKEYKQDSQDKGHDAKATEHDELSHLKQCKNIEI